MKSLACLLALSLSLTAYGKVETWTNTDGLSMEAELVSLDERQVTFRKADGSVYPYPLAKLSEADQSRARELAAQLPAKPAVTTAAPASPPGKLTADLTGKLVSLKGSALTPYSRENFTGAKYYAFYFSAEWCPPCRTFTPELVEAYKELKAKNPAFELVFVSSDESKDEMQAYMRNYKMPWPAVRFDTAKSLRAIQRYRGNGIPNLVFVDADGEVLSSSYVDDTYVGPRKVLRDIQKKLAGEG